jgi:5-methylcytosine-specific restriction endonuclease McrA
MANRWRIPSEVETLVRERDSKCVYCGIDFSISNESRKTRPTWEHIVNDIGINGIENIAFCCGSCNASKGSKQLEHWLKSKYCIIKRINKNSVATVVKNHLRSVSPPL